MHRTLVAQLRRVVLLALLAFVVAPGASWTLASSAAREALASATDTARAQSIARWLPRDDAPLTPQVLRVAAPSVPLTLVDSGGETALRAPRASTVAEALALNGIELGPQDRVSSAPDAIVNAGDVIRLVRVADQHVLVREPLASPVQVIHDAELVVGRVVVVTAGVPGIADNTYRVRLVDGVEAGRTLVGSVEIVTPVSEVRRVGTKPPPLPAEIEAVIRDAAATWGADPSQLLRVAWCESGYNPAAYNARSGASGLFQFMPATWAANRVRAGYAGASVFDAVASANTAAYMFHNGQAWQWSCK